MNPALAQFLLDNLQAFYQRDFLLEIFTHVTRTEIGDDNIYDAEIATVDTSGKRITVSLAPVYPGKLVIKNGKTYSVVNAKRIPDTYSYILNLKEESFELPTNGLLCNTWDPIDLPGHYLANYTGSDPLPTSVGRIMVNYLLLSRPFGDVIPYINQTTTGDKIGEIVRRCMVEKKITVEAYNQYVSNLFFFGHSPEMYSPNITPKSLMTSDNLHAIRDADLKTYQSAIAAGDAVEMARLEQKWIKIDKEQHLKGDPSLKYLRSGKVFNVVRKKLYITYGMVENMGDKGNFTFVPKSLEEGWTQDAIPTINSETRSGSYSRGIETADGGTVSKDILLVFQNTRVTQSDCGTTYTFNLPFHAGNSSGYIYRNYVDSSGAVKTITPDNYKSFEGTTVKLRSPTYCRGKQQGFCYTCMGKIFENLDQRVLATTILALGAKFSTAALKKMHGSSVSTVNISSLDIFCI